MDYLLAISVLIVGCGLSVAVYLSFRRASYALYQISEKIAVIPTTISEVLPDNSDPALVAEITSLTQRMTNLESFTDSRYKKMAAIDTRLGKHTRESAEEGDDGNLHIDYEALAQAVNSGKSPDVEPEKPRALNEAEAIRSELGL